MIPGEVRVKGDPISCYHGRKELTLSVANTGDRPVQVGSHFHFAEVNRELAFDRTQAIGMRLAVPAGTAVRFEPGEEKEVPLVAFGGNQVVYGLNDLTNGSTDQQAAIAATIQREGFKGKEG